MHNNPSLSVIIPWCNRAELATTLFCNAPFLCRPLVETLVVNVGGDVKQLSSLLERPGLPTVRQIDVKDKSFNKSMALNVGLASSRSTFVFTLDADVILLTDVLDEIDERPDGCYLTIEWVYESGRGPMPLRTITGGPTVGAFVSEVVHSNSLEFHLADGRKLLYRTARMNLSDGRRAGPGLLLAHRKHFLQVGGYDSNLRRWGWEDDDLQLRLRHVCGLSQIEVGAALHLTHGDESRVLTGIDRERSNRINLLQCCFNYNQNRFQGTFERDLDEMKDHISETTHAQKESIPRATRLSFFLGEVRPLSTPGTLPVDILHLKISGALCAASQQAGGIAIFTVPSARPPASACLMIRAARKRHSVVQSCGHTC
jgi:hypothetical protein